VPFVALEYVEDPRSSACCRTLLRRGGDILVLWGIDQLPESRSIVFIEEDAGDFSHGGTLALAMLAVRVEMEGRVWEDDAMGKVGGPNLDSSHGRWATEASILTRTSRRITGERVYRWCVFDRCYLIFGFVTVPQTTILLRFVTSPFFHQEHAGSSTPVMIPSTSDPLDRHGFPDGARWLEPGAEPRNSVPSAR
jgi:hypothetical protein